MPYPARVRVGLQRNAKVGLFAAVSPDLPGLMTVARTIDEIEERLPRDIQALIKAQYGEDVDVDVVDGDEDGFKPLDEPRVLELHAA